MNRRRLGIGIVVIWIAALLVLWHRRAAVSPAERLASAAMHLEPATYYYTILQAGKQIGVASSTLDTSTRSMRLTDVLNARAVVYGDSQSVSGSSAAYLSRSFALDSFALALGGDQGPYRLTGVPRGRSGVLLPTLAPMALMLSGEPRVGRSGRYWIFNPLSQRVELTTLAIAAESLMRVVDSATYDSTHDTWSPARTDTVRAWSVTTPTASLIAWVDADGRIVAASEPGGLSMTRTAYELATANQPKRSHTALTGKGHTAAGAARP